MKLYIRNNRIISGIAAALILCICIITGFSGKADADDAGFAVHVLDVGQGECVFIEADGHYVLFDGGGRDSSSYVVSYLKEHGVTELDYIVLSHYDEDHIAGAVGALKVFDCGMVIGPDYENDTDIYGSFVNACLEAGLDITHPAAGDSYALGNARITVIGTGDTAAEEENNRCIAVKISYGSTSVLICGDAQEEEENEIVSSGLEISADIYIVNHHGSSSSSSSYFLDAVNPVYAIISCGAGNSYGHPSSDALERIRSAGCILYRTDIQGEITAYSDGNSFIFDKEACNDWTEGTVQETAAVSEETSETASGEITYICNTNTGKFHYPYCDSVNDMKEKNKKYATESREELISQGYVPCKRCNP